MGDNLVAARQFSEICQYNIKALMSQEACEPSKAIAALEIIQTQARDLRARSILRAAQTAIEEYEGVFSASQQAGALLTLNKLVRQYTDGLDEIAPAETELFEGPSADDIATWKQVRETFLPLQRFAKTDREASTLKALASFGPFTQGEPANVDCESFELLMPAITDESLRQARESSKSVSVSYATDDILMTAALAEDVQEALIEVCQELVECSVEAPNRRQNQGLSGAAHIAITAKRIGSTFDVLISCEGPMASEAVLKGPKMEVLKDKGALFELSGKDNLVRIKITELPVSNFQDPVRLYDQALGMRA